MPSKNFLTPVFALLISAMFVSGGCAKAVGDECASNLECPSGAICDVTVQDGYCTIPSCERDSCPDDSVCVRFDRETSFCMKHCGSSDDCRDGYMCRDDIEGPKFCYVPAEAPVE